MFGRRRNLSADDTPAEPPGPLDRAIERLADQRASSLVTSRSQALELSVVMRARDVVCGVIAQLPFVRTAGGKDLGPGWLERPDPNHTRGWWVAQVVDDLFFHGYAWAWITVHDPDDGRPLAVEWMPYTQVIVDPDGLGVTYYRRGHDQAGTSEWFPAITELHLSWAEVLVFESPLSGVLQARRPLTIAARLDRAADRFANVEMPAGSLKQTAGDDLTTDQALDQIRAFEAARAYHTVAYLPVDLDYIQSGLDPDKLQLVEARSYQDAALARICNVPAFAVGVGIPHESLTYKTAFTARADVIDFGIAPYITCLEQTLSSNQVTPRGTVVTMDLEPFLRTAALRSITPTGGATADTAAAPTDQPAAV